MTICQNCETVVDGKFCSQCGQKANVKRITTRAIFSDFIKKITLWDKGLLYTTARLMKSPGKMARAYLKINGAWRDHIKTSLGRVAPFRLTDGRTPAYRDWSQGYDPDTWLDRSIHATRMGAFPLHGLDPLP